VIPNRDVYEYKLATKGAVVAGVMLLQADAGEQVTLLAANVAVNGAVLFPFTKSLRDRPVTVVFAGIVSVISYVRGTPHAGVLFNFLVAAITTGGGQGVDAADGRAVNVVAKAALGDVSSPPFVSLIVVPAAEYLILAILSSSYV